MGVLTGLVGGASGSFPLMAGLLRDAAASCDMHLLLVAGVFVISTLITLSLGAYPARLETAPVHPTWRWPGPFLLFRKSLGRH